ncbi:uncharacterized protein LOC130720299 [Lotus japonicus]|uniref:uncharacterized protein LOC130720299 n=1 Tax=Lotus japonicus TaxID=34305 RepID=UPI0025836C39|nr:uncharacterized protein LOC130720299 [Lotus japonicus]
MTIHNQTNSLSSFNIRIQKQKNITTETKMSVVITNEIRAKSEIYHGDLLCQEKSKELLKEIALPNGLLPLKDIEECGYHRESGFVWLKQKKSNTHKFEKIGKLVSYATEVTAYVEVGKIKKLTGVKTKELLVWITLNDIYVDNPPTGKITFQTPAGLYRTFPVSAFEIKEEKPVTGVVKEEENKHVKEAVGAAAGAVQVKEV